MSFYALRVKPDFIANCPKNVFMGKKMGFLGNTQGQLLLYSSKKEATNKAKSEDTEETEIFRIDSQIPGFSLVEIASIDHFSSAILDDNLPIIFFSCLSGRFLLPSHFYMKDKEGFRRCKKMINGTSETLILRIQRAHVVGCYIHLIHFS